MKKKSQFQTSSNNFFNFAGLEEKSAYIFHAAKKGKEDEAKERKKHEYHNKAHFLRHKTPSQSQPVITVPHTHTPLHKYGYISGIMPTNNIIHTRERNIQRSSTFV